MFSENYFDFNQNYFAINRDPFYANKTLILLFLFELIETNRCSVDSSSDTNMGEFVNSNHKQLKLTRLCDNSPICFLDNQTDLYYLVIVMNCDGQMKEKIMAPTFEFSNLREPWSNGVFILRKKTVIFS